MDEEKLLNMNWRFLPILTLATALFAQGPGGHGFGPHRMAMQAKTDQVQSYLSLTAAQIQSLQQLHQSEMTALKPIFDQIQQARQSLHTQLQSGSADATALGKLLLSIQSLEQQVSTSRTSLQQQATAVLTADQKTKLAALQNAASLMPTINEAMALNLLTPPKGAEFGMAAGGPGIETFVYHALGRPE